jgi:competence ComEA-like helix-hairpin-helix protein
MWGREMRAGLVFVLLSLALGSAFREWRRSHEVRFADLVRELEAGDARSRGEEAPGDARSPNAEAGAPDSASGRASRPRSRHSGALRPGVIDLDRATAEELERLPGIGPSLAARIVAERERGGAFQGPDALLRVPGIGPRKLEAIRPFLARPPAPADSGSPIAN